MVSEIKDTIKDMETNQSSKDSLSLSSLTAGNNNDDHAYYKQIDISSIQFEHINNVQDIKFEGKNELYFVFKPDILAYVIESIRREECI